MNLTTMKEYFLVLQDKYGSSYYTDSEIDLFLNRAQIDEVSSLLPSDGSTLNVELNQNTINQIEPLLFSVNVNMVIAGTVSTTTIEAAINTAYGIDYARVLRVLSIGWNNERPIKYTRNNNWYMYLANVFKAPSSSNPRTKQDQGKWIIRPIDTSATLTFNGLRYPREMSTDTDTSCELPDFTHNSIVARALELAGVGSRDQMLAELQKINNV